MCKLRGEGFLSRFAQTINLQANFSGGSGGISEQAQSASEPSEPLNSPLRLKL